MSVGRLFLAVPVDADVRGGLIAHLEEQLGRPVPGRAVAPENWHLTVRFLGDVDQVPYERLLRRLDEADLGPGFDLRFGGLGAFPHPARATVLWLGVEEGGERLADVARTVEEAVVAAGLPAEERPFRPHLTLSRIRPQRDVRAEIDAVDRFPLRLPVRELVLYRSHQRPTRYEPIERFPLATNAGTR